MYIKVCIYQIQIDLNVSWSNDIKCCQILNSDFEKLKYRKKKKKPFLFFYTFSLKFSCNFCSYSEALIKKKTWTFRIFLFLFWYLISIDNFVCQWTDNWDGFSVISVNYLLLHLNFLLYYSMGSFSNCTSFHISVLGSFTRSLECEKLENYKEVVSTCTLIC